MGRNVSCSNHLKNIMFMKKIMMTLATLFVAGKRLRDAAL